jgi:hypothetical protein
MRWLKRVIRNWLRDDEPALGNRPEGSNYLNLVATVDNPAAIMVAPIDNGFLIMSRKYNPSGPDHISATFAADADTLSAALISRMAQARLKM